MDIQNKNYKVLKCIGKGIRTGIELVFAILFDVGSKTYNNISKELKEEQDNLAKEKSSLWMSDVQSEERKKEITKRQKEIERIQKTFDSIK